MEKEKYQLRPYQQQTHDQLIEAFRSKETPLIILPTGSGKTFVMTSFMAKLLKFYDFVIIVRQIELVEQFNNTVQKFGLNSTMFMAGKPYDESAPIVVCSIDTLSSRKEYPKRQIERDLVVLIDEADETTSNKYQAAIKAYKQRTNVKTFSVMPTNQIRPAFIAGFTATAFDKALTSFTKIIEPLTPDQALEQGFLVPFTYKVPELFDFDDVAIEKGEFKPKDLDIKFNSLEVTRLSLNAWLNMGDNRQTLIFTNSQDHAENVAKYFNDYFQKDICKIVTSKVSPKDRKIIYQEFKNGLIRFIVNVKVITRGVDIPEIGCILDIAPTTLQNLHIQKIGRGARINPIYKDCILIDVANNCVRLGPFYKMPRIPRIEPFKRVYKKSDTVMDVCLSCRNAFIKTHKIFSCPFCGERIKRDEAKQEKKSKNVKLQFEGKTDEQIKQIKMINDFKKILFVKRELTKQYQNDIVGARKAAHDEMINRYGIEAVRKIAFSIGFKE